MLKDSKIVAIVPDRYDIQDSIKIEERIRRMEKCVAPIIDINDLTRLPKNLHQYLKQDQSRWILFQEIKGSPFCDMVERICYLFSRTER